MLTFFGCSHNKGSKELRLVYGYEIRNHDTVNIIKNGLKQGKWIPTEYNKLKDTFYYRNDTVIN